MLEQVRTFFWYLQRPNLYPHLLYLLSKKLLFRTSLHENTKQEAELWCSSNSIDTKTAIERITGLPMKEQIRIMFPDIFAIADQRAAECPVKMGGAGNLDLIYWLAEYSESHNVVETGVAYGWSSLALLLSLKNRPGSILISTDMPYVRLNSERYVGCVVPIELRSQWHILRYADRPALPRALNKLGTIDMCHYDSDKSFEGKMWAYSIIWKALRKGGILISDDIGDNIAFRNFSKSVAIDPIVIKFKRKYIGVLIKSNIE